MKKILFVLLFLFAAMSVHAQGTFYTNSCSYPDVNDCINGGGLGTCHSGSPTGAQATHVAVDGDTIIMGTCTNTTVGCSTGNSWGCNTSGSNNQQLQVNVGITLKGQDNPGGNQGGTYQTVIIDNNYNTTCTGNARIIIESTATNHAARYTGFTVRAGNGTGQGLCSAHILFQGNSKALRIDHLQIDDDSYAGGTCTQPIDGQHPGFGSIGTDEIQITGDEWGVYDHNLFRSCRRHGVFVFNTIWDGGTHADKSWSEADSLGMPGLPANGFNAATGSCNGVGSVPCQAAMVGENNTYVQDVNNTGSNPVSCEQGDRCVTRFSNFATQDGHGFEQTAQGQRHHELYGNTISPSTKSCGGPSCSSLTALDIRSGLGLVFENQITNSATYTYTPGVGVSWENFRCNNCSPPNTFTPWGNNCNGTASTGSNGIWDYVVNFPSPNSGPSPCIGQIGRGPGDLINRSVAAWPHEVLEGAYSWKNKYNGTLDPAGNVGGPGSPQQFFSNLDYYTGVGGVGTGATGVGYGTLAQIPSTCSMSGLSQDGQRSGTAYWATDQGNWNQSGTTFYDGTSQGVLFKCSPTNTGNVTANGLTFSCVTAGSNFWCPYYEPYVYPHPLVSAGGTSPAPPTSLHVVSVQ